MSPAKKQRLHKALGLQIPLLLKLTLLALLTSFLNPVFSQNALGIFQGHSDVGTGVKPGSATYIPENGQYVISGAGYNVWADHDEFQYVWKKVTGDFIL